MAKDATSMYMVVPSPPHSFKTVARISMFSKAIVWRVLSLQIKPREMDYAADVVWKVSMNVRYLITFFAVTVAIRIECNRFESTKKKVTHSKDTFSVENYLKRALGFLPIDRVFQSLQPGDLFSPIQLDGSLLIWSTECEKCAEF